MPRQLGCAPGSRGIKPLPHSIKKVAACFGLSPISCLAISATLHQQIHSSTTSTPSTAPSSSIRTLTVIGRQQTSQSIVKVALPSLASNASANVSPQCGHSMLRASFMRHPGGGVARAPDNPQVSSFRSSIRNPAASLRRRRGRARCARALRRAGRSNR